MKNNSLYGTAIMAVSTPDEIVVSADSRGCDLDGTLISDDICKIVPFAGGYITAAGCREVEEVNYNFSKIVEETINPDLGLADNKYFLLKSIEPLLSAAANFEKNANEEFFVENWVNKTPLSICIFGLEDDDLIFIVCEYSVVSHNGESVMLTNKYQQFKNGGIRGLMQFLVGKSNLTDNYSKRVSLGHYPETLANFSRDFVQANIDEDDGVGGAIDTIRITRAGVEWIEKKNSCK